MMLSVVIPHFFPQREGNLTTIVQAYAGGTRRPDEILVWNNDAPLARPVDGIRLIQSPWNLGCKGRFMGALAAAGDWLLFQDNDVTPRPETVANLMRWAKKRPDAILSLDGREITKGEAYKGSERVTGRKVTVPTRISITLGRMELMHRSAMMKVLAAFPWRDDTIMDDLEFSAAAARVGVPCYVVPCDKKSEAGNLDTHGVGLSVTHKDEYYSERERVCQDIFASGGFHATAGPAAE
jgi:hypothetical protein